MTICGEQPPSKQGRALLDVLTLSGTTGAGGTPPAAIRAQEPFPVKEGHGGHEQFLAPVAGFINFMRRHGVRREFQAVFPPDHLELLGDLVQLVMENHRRRAILGKEQAMVVLGKVISCGIANDHSEIREAVPIIVMSWHLSRRVDNSSALARRSSCGQHTASPPAVQGTPVWLSQSCRTSPCCRQPCSAASA
jgi:hypothetical protein